MVIAFQIFAVLLCTVTVLSVTDRKAWWIRIFDFPRLQIIVLQFITILVLIFVPEDMNVTSALLILFTIIAIATHLYYIYPYFPFTKKEVKNASGVSGNGFSVMICNVLMDNRKHDKLLDQIAQIKPDIFLAVETDQWWNDKLSALDGRYKYAVKYPLNNTYGMLLYSKLPLENSEVKFLVRHKVPSIHADVVTDDIRIKLSCLHPEPPAPDEADTSKPRDRELIKMARHIRDTKEPYIVIGDFNDVAWSDTSKEFQKISKLKDPRKGRGLMNTFNAKYPFIRWALDHVFISEAFKLEKIRRLPAVGSDHFPVYARLVLE